MPLLAAAVLGVVAVGAIVLFLPNDSARIESIAVLPFDNGNDDPEAEYFSDGVTESIISSLSKLPDVRVISRTSAFQYKGQTIDPETVGQELEVDALVLGRIVQRGDDLAISAELVRTEDSGQVWGEQYRRRAADILSIQTDMAREISDALRIQLTTEQEQLLTKQYTTSSEAYAAYLRGRYHWNRRSEDGIRQAIVHFREAIDEDPSYALAYSGLADSYGLLGFYYDPPRETFPRATEAAARALDLDDDLAEAHASLAFTKLMYDWDFVGAEQEFLRSIELDPTYATAHHWYSACLFTAGRLEESLQQIRIALELDPLSRIINSDAGHRLSALGRYAEAHEQFNQGLELDPTWAVGLLRLGENFQRQGLHAEAIPYYERAAVDDFQWAVALLGHAYAKSGRVEDAYRVLERLDEMAKTRYVSPFHRAAVYAGLDDVDAFFDAMDRAYEHRTGMLTIMSSAVWVPDVERDPRYAELARRIELAE